MEGRGGEGDGVEGRRWREGGGEVEGRGGEGDGVEGRRGRGGVEGG